MCEDFKPDGNTYKVISSHPLLTPNERALLNKITSLASNKNNPSFECYASNSKLAEFMNVSAKTISNIISILVKDKFLFVKSQKNKNNPRIPNKKRILDRTTPRDKYNAPEFEEILFLDSRKASPDIQEGTFPNLGKPPPDIREQHPIKPQSPSDVDAPLDTLRYSIEYSNQKSEKEALNENTDWNDLYEYVMCVFLKLDPKTRKATEHKKVSGTVAARLHQLSKGITGGAIKNTGDLPIKYPFPTILWTFKEVESSVCKKFFENIEFHNNPNKKFTYALAAVSQNIDYQLKKYNNWIQNKKEINLWKVISPLLEERCTLYDEIMVCVDLKETTKKIKRFNFLNEDVLKQITKGFGKESKEYKNYMLDYVAKENIPSRVKDIKSGKAKALKDFAIKREELYDIGRKESEALEKLGREIGRFNIQYKRESEINVQNFQKRREQIRKWEQELKRSYP